MAVATINGTCTNLRPLSGYRTTQHRFINRYSGIFQNDTGRILRPLCWSNEFNRDRLPFMSLGRGAGMQRIHRAPTRLELILSVWRVKGIWLHKSPC